MLKPYRTVQDVLSSPWAQVQRAKSSSQQTDRVLRSTKLEDSIYRDLRMEDTGMDEIENSAGEKLRSFPALSRDIFQSFYSLMPRRNTEDDLSVAARKINMPILEHITQSEDYPTLKAVCEGRELPAYGRGEKYALELGNDLSRALTSELAMLAVPETLPLFLRKYQHRQIKQYRRREPVYKGAGDIICCLDESGSTAGDLAAWGKAVALTLLEIAQSEGRKFALVHFSGPGRFQTDVFLPGQSSLEEKLHAAETFLGGGTDFQTPLAEAERLMREGGFENADIAFITDGECSLPETCVEMLQKAQSELRFTVTGILLDEGNAGMDFSLKPFCQNIYRTSELTGDQIVWEIVLDRV